MDINQSEESLESKLFVPDEDKAVENFRLNFDDPNLEINLWPRHWDLTSIYDNCIRYSKDKLKVKNLITDFVPIYANKTIPQLPTVYYFEVHIISSEEHAQGTMMICLNYKIGKPYESLYFYSNHGLIFGYFNGYKHGIDEPIAGSTYGKGDIVGCGINFKTQQVFFTKNGQKLSDGVFDLNLFPLFPKFVFSRKLFQTIDTNFGQKPFVYNLKDEISLKNSMPSRMPDIKKNNLTTVKSVTVIDQNSKQNQSSHDKIAEYFSDIIKPSLFIPDHDQKEYNINPDEDFQFQKFISRTTTCCVNLYLHKQSGIKMAIKSILIPIQENRLDKQKLKYLKREVELLTALRNNSNITTFYGAFIKEYELNVCIEYMDMSLEKYYKNVHKIQNYFPELLVGIISVNLIIGLSACKKIQVIHRDIKPRNILVNRSGQIKLCDFGWARILNDSLASTFGGTLAYMPPERFLKDQNKFDIRNDVWSLGISLIEIIYGRQPFEKSENNNELEKSGDNNELIVVMNRVMNFDNSLFEKILQKYSPKTKQFILGCLAKIDERPKYENLEAMEFFNYYVKFKDPEIASMILKACEETSIDNLPISVCKNIALKVFGQNEKMMEVYKLFVNESEKIQ